jgi:hypothetical protein
MVIINPLIVLWLRKKKNEKMVTNAVTTFTNYCTRRISDPELYSGVNELNHDNDSGDCRGNNHYNLWVSIKEMVWGKHKPYFSFFRGYSRYRFSIYNPHSWRSFFTGGSYKSSQSGTVSNRDRSRNRHYCYYGILIGLLTVAPVRAEDGDTNNTSNPVAAATGNVTNQAVQFQNNGAPSRQHYGPNISCNGATMTFSPFYMGNHTTPFDEQMVQKTYTVAENWGGQVNFMIPLDRKGLKQCRRIAARQEEKMRLDYELVRVLKCGDLQKKGFMLRKDSRVYDMCSDVIAIAAHEKEKKEKFELYLEENCTPKKGIKMPWKEQEYECKTTTKK